MTEIRLGVSVTRRGGNQESLLMGVKFFLGMMKMFVIR